MGTETFISAQDGFYELFLYKTLKGSCEEVVGSTMETNKDVATTKIRSIESKWYMLH